MWKNRKYMMFYLFLGYYFSPLTIILMFSLAKNKCKHWHVLHSIDLNSKHDLLLSPLLCYHLDSAIFRRKVPKMAWKWCATWRGDLPWISGGLFGRLSLEPWRIRSLQTLANGKPQSFFSLCFWPFWGEKLALKWCPSKVCTKVSTIN